MHMPLTRRAVEVLGPGANGTLMTPQEFDRAEFEEGWRYELVNGVLIVTPMPLNNEVDPNEELGTMLRNYQRYHPQGAALDYTAYERTIRVGKNRRRMDRAIWAGLGRAPHKHEVPTFAVEFVSKGKRNRARDYITKRDDYLRAKVQEYWI